MAACAWWSKALLNINTGDVLLDVAVREDTAGNPSGVFLSDYAGGWQDYLVVGNDFCRGSPIPAAVVSRKTHGSAGPFGVNLKPPVAGIECRSCGGTGDQSHTGGRQCRGTRTHSDKFGPHKRRTANTKHRIEKKHRSQVKKPRREATIFASVPNHAKTRRRARPNSAKPTHAPLERKT
jgi:hypothetical protein